MGYAIVVDTCVARAAGQTDDPVARKCLQALDAITDSGHSLAMSKPLQDEWFKSRSEHREPYSQYASMYTLAWFVSMRTKRRVLWIEIEDSAELRNQILEASGKQNYDEIQKDLYLVETALASDKRVLSIDDRVRKHFCDAGQIVKQLCEILWLNPARDAVSNWLWNGAPDKQEYRLCDVIV